MSSHDGIAGRQSENYLSPIDDSGKIEAVISAIEAFDITETTAWHDLVGLSSRTEIESVEPNLDGLFQSADGTRFEVLGNVYVTLNYGGKKDSVSMGDSYPFHAYGRLGENEAVIDDIQVDTSSFSE